MGELESEPQPAPVEVSPFPLHGQLEARAALEQEARLSIGLSRLRRQMLSGQGGCFSTLGSSPTSSHSLVTLHTALGTPDSQPF